MSRIPEEILHVERSECSPRMLLQALCKNGALMLTEALPVAIVERAFAEAHAALGESGGYVEWQHYNPENRTGYTPAGIEKSPGSGLNWHRHFFDYRPGMVTLYPSPCSDALEPLHRYLTELGETLCMLIDHEAHLSLRSIIRNGPHILRVTECLNEEVDPERELFGSHLDFGLLTLFVGGSTPGLQVLSGGKWIDADAQKGNVLVGAGTILKQYLPASTSLRHRVMANSARRLSLFQFIEPRADVVLPNKESADTFLKRVLKSVREDA